VGLSFANQFNFLFRLPGVGVSRGGAITRDSGTIFQVSFLDMSQSNFLFSNDLNGVAAAIDVAADGTLTTVAQPGSSVAATPEPATWSLVGLAGVLMCVVRQRKRWAA
jgi:hypothetical protein